MKGSTRTNALDSSTMHDLDQFFMEAVTTKSFPDPGFTGVHTLFKGPVLLYFFFKLDGCDSEVTTAYSQADNF